GAGIAPADLPLVVRRAEHIDADAPGARRWDRPAGFEKDPLAGVGGDGVERLTRGHPGRRRGGMDALELQQGMDAAEPDGVEAEARARTEGGKRAGELEAALLALVAQATGERVAGIFGPREPDLADRHPEPHLAGL